MPTYDYRCDECAHEFERFQSITERPLRQCPACGKRKLRRLIGTGAAVIFRGSGFYCTDYKKGARPAGGSDGGGSSVASGDSTAPDKAADKPGGSKDGAKKD
jgi:putative FmdB family regulatory protein